MNGQSAILLVPALGWPSVLLAAGLAGDALVSLRPPAFVRRCLHGVGLPRDWWWVLIVVKLLAAAGLVVGLWVPGVGAAAALGAVVYFCCAATAHVRARFCGRELWLNCLGMLGLSAFALVADYLV